MFWLFIIKLGLQLMFCKLSFCVYEFKEMGKPTFNRSVRFTDFFIIIILIFFLQRLCSRVFLSMLREGRGFTGLSGSQQHYSFTFSIYFIFGVCSLLKLLWTVAYWNKLIIKKSLCRASLVDTQDQVEAFWNFISAQRIILMIKNVQGVIPWVVLNVIHCDLPF